MVVTLLLGGCASSGSHDDSVWDPFEPVNRQIFAFNHTLDKHAALPAASYYKSAVPDTARDGVHNFLSNLTLPVTFANDVLQGEATRAGDAVGRFGVNTTIGILGVMDPASGMGLAEHDEDGGHRHSPAASAGSAGGPSAAWS